MKKSRSIKNMLGGSYSKDLEQLFPIICELFDEMVMTAGSLPINAEGYKSLLKTVFSETKIGRIPAFVEQVTFGDASTVRLKNKKYVYILGANRGEFPRAADDSDYFTDADKRALARIGLEIDSGDDIRAAKELYYFARAISYAKDELTVTYHAADTAFKASPPSEAVGRITSITGG